MKFIMALLLLGVLVSCNKNDKVESKANMDNEFREFLSGLESQLSKAYTGSATSYFNATISGKDEDYAKYSAAEMEMNKLLSNKETFEKLKNFQENGNIQNDTLKRALYVMYNQFLSKQNDTNLLNQISQLSSEIEKKFSTFRAKVGSKDITDNEVEEILKKETNSKKLEEAWLAHKKVGEVVAPDIIKLVKLRNQAAKELGFKNFQDMNLRMSEQDPDSLDVFFDELDRLTASGFANLKSEINAFLAKKYKINESDLMPWHHQNRYFQEAPEIYDLNLDALYAKSDVVELTRKYYESIGSPIDDMLAKSDLYEKKGKYQHAYCTDIDRNTKDIRVVCNVTPTHKWMETMLHEFGHAVYFKYHDEKLPWILKQPAHTFATEGVAMFYGRLATSPAFMVDVLGIKPEEAAKIAETSHKIMRLQQLVFSRWVQVVYRFEKAMYSDPDQDLNKVWWDLVEKYQLMKRPEGRNSPDWGTKIHIASYPCYYHNYLLGEIFASQLYAYINEQVLKNPAGSDNSFFNKPETAKYWIDKVYSVGNLYYWDDMMVKATGERLTPKYYAKQFVD